MTYQRIPGGEKNLKSGVKWTKDELTRVYYLYKELNGEGLHERNPKLIELANDLGRTVRSTEAQTLMYRNLERGGDYSHGNMNTLCKTIWEEMEETETAYSFPEGLLDWAGHKRGGVKKPFDRGSGRPNGKVIKTQLTKKIDDWVSSDISTRPKILLFVGGPGNGKTDALEYLISQIDAHYGSDYFGQIENDLNLSKGIVPRSIEIDLNREQFSADKLVIVQDASTGQDTRPSEECLIDDLINALNDDMIYIACINRGILAEAVTLAESKDPDVYELLNSIISGITENINHISLWPMDQANHLLKNVGVWPMDIESLVNPLEDASQSPAFQIISAAVDDKNWKCADCAISNELCPFYQNKEALKSPDKLEGLLRLLHDFEIINNNRWTFRELFSLISYLIVGFEHEFDGIGPCSWSKKKILESSGSDIKKRVQAVWDLNDHLYHFRLFSKWPTFDSVSRSKKQEIRDIFRESTMTKEFFGYFTYKRTKKRYKPDIASIVDKQFFDTIDPGQLSDVNIKFPKEEILLREIESSFSYSVASGFEKTQHLLNPLESRLFEEIVAIEKELDGKIRFESAISSARIDKMLVLVRMVASRYFKRVFLSGGGISKDEIYLREYRNLNPSRDSDLKKLKKARDLFDSLVQNSTGLTVILNSSISQPQLPEDIQVKLQVRRIQIRYKYVQDTLRDVPRTDLRVFSIEFGDSLLIPLTYQLYKALSQLKEGVRPASLPKDVLAMIDSIKSKIAGNIVRDPDVLANSRIQVGDSSLYYRIDELDKNIEISTQNI